MGRPATGAGEADAGGPAASGAESTAEADAVDPAASGAESTTEADAIGSTVAADGPFGAVVTAALERGSSTGGGPRTSGLPPMSPPAGAAARLAAPPDVSSWLAARARALGRPHPDDDVAPPDGRDWTTPPLLRVAWGDRLLDALLPPAPTRCLMIADQRGSELDALLLRMASAELAAGRTVHWVDGGSRLDPTRFVPHLRWRGADPREVLRHLLVSRGFTAHQVLAQVDALRVRLTGEVEPDGPPVRLIIADRLPHPFADPSLRTDEARRLFTHAVERLASIARVLDALVLITWRRHSIPPLPAGFVEVLARCADLRLHAIASGRGRRRHRALRLELEPWGRRVQWFPLPWPQASLLDFASAQRRPPPASAGALAIERYSGAIPVSEPEPGRGWTP